MKNEHEESKEVPQKGNLLWNFRNLFSKKLAQKIYPRKIITIAVGAVALVSSACIYLVQKKD
ncbi:hypothetical protein [Flavobacterium sp.]|uniref:hypothetical protein n=1 Tax=Flavobacterium sp. TaxID=239 RepID=UPI0031D6D0C2